MTDSQLARYQGKLELSGELGEKCQDQATAIEREAQQSKGAAEALRATGSQINKQLVAILDKEWGDGDFAECDSPEAARGKVKRYISRAVGFCENLSAIAKNSELISSGKAKALEEMAKLLGKHNDAAAARIRQIQSPPEPTNPDSLDLDGKGNPRRRPGDRPVSISEMVTTYKKKKASKVKAGKLKPGKKKSGKKAGRRKKD